MHASIAVCLMLVGGAIAPESEITVIPLMEDLSARTRMQDLQWQERVKRFPLPRVPTVQIDDGASARDNARAGGRRSTALVPPTDPNAPRRKPAAMPSPPIQLGDSQGGRRNMPSVPGAGRYLDDDDSSDPYSGRSVAGPSSVRSYGNANTMAPRSAISPSAADYSRNITSRASAERMGFSSNPILNPSVGGGPKPFNDYRRPSGYSPWMGLYSSRTNNGTVNPYYNTVLPAQQQQQFNSQVSEQIRGVQSQGHGYGGGTPGVEVPQGAGMANPNTFLNYKGYYPGNQ